MGNYFFYFTLLSDKIIKHLQCFKIGVLRENFAAWSLERCTTKKHKKFNYNRHNSYKYAFLEQIFEIHY
ncbi:MAG: hypothetical protein A2275_06590 [Bacteroidetes bacterium RIFOXYA12_FULL_35_11]|nr:MAG: hypothetical protein A2X01_04060 [Bacteroidetes bacterium GWF2_35_48]OFY76742.1 MAG: hypothetical protein A2275_06590 [Bacteroidetes bacterium RIFOXYA12_FULL_35_11]OFZ06232.1 MAG: hypothetical protein A2491_13385 [Bacteroidetes bacterium RIFOXYC12_FULL_35_7]HBX52337.1 hypothetical protein [Bacteroidales bacterium]